MAYEKKTEKRDYIKEAAERMIEAVLSGKTKEWKTPWSNSTALPYNPLTGKQYRGANAMSLGMAGYTDPRFLTYAQIQLYGKKHGLDLKLENATGKGLPVFKAVDMVFRDNGSRSILKEGDEQENGGIQKYKVMVYAGTVFNAEHIKGMPKFKETELKEIADTHLLEKINDVSKAMEQQTNLTVEHKHIAAAYYIVDDHKVVVPHLECFENDLTKYGNVLSHEIIHSTGPLLGRDMSGSRRGGAERLEKYAYEELVAEMGSYIMGMHYGLKYQPEHHENHEAYLQSWIKKIRDKPEMLLKAANQSHRAVSFVEEKLVDFYISQQRFDDAVEPFPFMTSQLTQNDLPVMEHIEQIEEKPRQRIEQSQYFEMQM